MKVKIGLVLSMAASLIFISSELVFSQDVQTETLPLLQVPETPAESETQWLWGEVVSTDIQKNELRVKYLDYETDQEKEMVINVDEKTTYENVLAIDEIKPLDTVSIDYMVNPEGKNIAKNISVEKPETESVHSQEATPETAPEVTPSDLQPTTTP